MFKEATINSKHNYLVHELKFMKIQDRFARRELGESKCLSRGMGTECNASVLFVELDLLLD